MGRLAQTLGVMKTLTRPSARTRITGILVLTFVVSVTLLAIMPTPAPGTFSMEIAKALLQLGVVSVIGAVVSLLAFEYQREQQNADKNRDEARKSLEYREDLLKTILSRATVCYSQMKKARRMFRARGLQRLGDFALVEPEEYDKCLESINDAQLEIENIARDVKSSERAFTHSELIVKNLRAMEQYLSNLVGEYEKQRGTLLLREGKVMLDDLDRMSEFLLTANQSQFKPQFIVSFHEVQQAIRSDLLHPNLLAKDDA